MYFKKCVSLGNAFFSNIQFKDYSKLHYELFQNFQNIAVTTTQKKHRPLIVEKFWFNT